MVLFFQDRNTYFVSSSGKVSQTDQNPLMNRQPNEDRLDWSGLYLL